MKILHSKGKLFMNEMAKLSIGNKFVYPISTLSISKSS